MTERGGTEDLTVSVRVRWSGTGGAWQWIYALGTDNGRYLFSTPSNADSRLRTAITTGGGGTAEDTITGYAALPAEEWRTLTVSLDTAAEQLTTYLDGVAVDSTSTTITAAELLTDQATSAGYLGRSFYSDPRLRGAVDDFRIYHAALSQEQVADVVGGELATITGLADDEIAVRTTVDVAPELPHDVRATYSDGYDRRAAATWEDIDPESYASSGTFTVSPGPNSGMVLVADSLSNCSFSSC